MFALAARFYRCVGLGERHILESIGKAYTNDTSGQELADTVQCLCNIFYDNPQHITFFCKYLRSGDSFQLSNDFNDTRCIRITSNGTITYRSAFGFMTRNTVRTVCRRYFRLDCHILCLLRVAVSQQERRVAVTTLRGGDAQRALDVILKLLIDDSYWASEMPDAPADARRVLALLLTSLAQHAGIFPPSLYLRNVRLSHAARSVYPFATGSSSDVYEGTYCNETVAIKHLRHLQDATSRPIENVLLSCGLEEAMKFECLLWCLLRHENIVPLLGITDSLRLLEGVPSMVSPLMEHGSLMSHIRTRYEENNPPTTDQLNFWLFQIAAGLRHLHDRGIVHGDLRAVNVFVDTDGHAQVGDFGRSFFAGARHSSERIMTTSADGLLTEAPGTEIVMQAEFAGDVLAFAFLCIEVYTSRDPFKKLGYSCGQASARVLDGIRPTRPRTRDGEIMGDIMWDLVNSCWSSDFASRPTMTEIYRRLSSLVPHSL